MLTYKHFSILADSFPLLDIIHQFFSCSGIFFIIKFYLMLAKLDKIYKYAIINIRKIIQDPVVLRGAGFCDFRKLNSNNP